MPFISALPTHFLRGGSPFFALGFNAYYLGFSSSATQQSVLEAAKDAGASALRVWAFLDATDDSASNPAFQRFTRHGIEINQGPTGLLQLDRLIAMAEEYGIALILPLLNYWPDFGGMPLYAKYFAGSDRPEDFYTSLPSRTAYRRWVEALLTRCNSFTGRYYVDEPAIMAWELANEPRHTGPGGREELLDWVADASAFVKSMDGNHLLAVGDEGFFYDRGKSHLYRGDYGVDTEAFLNLSAIDFGTYHFYPEHWGVSANSARRWIEDHAALARRVGKPVLLEEFGLLPSTETRRAECYRDWASLACTGGSAGALFWMLGANHPDASGYCDRFTIYESPRFDAELTSRERLRFRSVPEQGLPMNSMAKNF